MTGGRVERVERHASRLRRDAARLGLPLPDRLAIETLFAEAARERFGDGDGIVRIEWSKRPGRTPELIPAPRPLGEERGHWTARTSKLVHPGREHRRNTKYVDVEIYDLARTESVEAGVDEVLLFDADGFLVEGGGSNFLVVTQQGRLVTPDYALGGVEGIGLSVVRDGHPEIEGARLRREDLDTASELMSCNGVRGVVPIIALDGRAVGDGAPGPTAQRLRQIFFREI